jgi:predicted ester cyclase
MTRKLFLLGIALSLVVGLLASCSGAKKADLDAAKAQVTTLQSQLSAANAAKTKADANKALVRRYFEIVNLPDLKGYEELASPNYKRYVSANDPPLTIDANKKRMLGFHAVFPDDFLLTVEDMVAEGDLVAARQTFTGTQKGAFMGIPPTGIKVKIWDVEVFRIENGKIAEQWGGPDIFNSLQQTGAVISAGK